MVSRKYVLKKAKNMYIYIKYIQIHVYIYVINEVKFFIYIYFIVMWVVYI